MPRSTLSAVRTPGSDRPSSTSVIATAGLHADDHGLGVEDARHAGDVAEHPADERVDHLERGDVDQHALGAGLRRSASVRSSCSVIASWSCMSTWMVTSRKSPILQDRDAVHAVLPGSVRRG